MQQCLSPRLLFIHRGFNEKNGAIVNYVGKTIAHLLLDMDIKIRLSIT